MAEQFVSNDSGEKSTFKKVNNNFLPAFNSGAESTLTVEKDKEQHCDLMKNNLKSTFVIGRGWRALQL